MTIKELMHKCNFEVINRGENLEQEITKPFCCDLLSIAMSRLPAGSAWVTVMGNINTIAVCTLTDAGCVILAEGSRLDDMAFKKATDEGITVFRTELPIFEAALQIQELV